MDKELMNYFIEQTDKRFDKVETKLDQLLSFKWKLAGAIGLVSFVVTIGVQFMFKLKGM